MMNQGNKAVDTIILSLTVMIWGSLYVAGRRVMQSMPALVLLECRLVIASAILLAAARLKGLPLIRREDFKELFFISFAGYFLSNAALLLGIEYSTASFSSLLNAMNPIFISVFAMLILKEKPCKKQIAALLVAVTGALVIIGNPGKGITAFGTVCCLFSTVVWSLATIHIKKLNERYDPILVTGEGMGLAALFNLPAAALYVGVSGVEISLTPSIILPVLYICVICTAVSHLMWNSMLARIPASVCAGFYPLQPLSSMALGILLLGEKVSASFLAGAALILAAMVVHLTDPAKLLSLIKGFLRNRAVARGQGT